MIEFRRGNMVTATNIEGRWIIYDRRRKRLIARARRIDNKHYLAVGQIVNGELHGRPASYWLDKVRKGIA